MYELILQVILMVSLAVIVYLIAIAVPRVEEKAGGEEGRSNNHAIHLSLDRMDAFLNRVKERLLRRVKVMIMKADNYVSRQLNKNGDEL